MTTRRVPLGGCDRYLLALEDYMVSSGQGRHAAVTFLEVGPGFSALVLREACLRFAECHPLAGAKLSRGLPGSVPVWKIFPEPSGVEVREHGTGTNIAVLAGELMDGKWQGLLRFDVVPPAQGPSTVLMSWSHLLFDARGAELALAEIAGLSAADGGAPRVRNSWGVPDAAVSGLPDRLRKVRVFVDRYYELRSRKVMSLSGPPPARSASRCAFLHFSAEETSAMRRRAEHLTAGIFVMPYFLAVAMRAHAAVLESRGRADSSLECAISAQCRKRGALDPVWQNQVSQLFFTLDLRQTASLAVAAVALQEQFASMTRSGCDAAFLIMVNWMRRLPAFVYRRFLRRTASGQITSFYHAYTGTFLAGLRHFCGGEFLDGWHAPSVSQPPGTGLFFSECRGRLTISLCWREGTISAQERGLMLSRLREDLLGADGCSAALPNAAG
ncbi:MAG: hypothetical protein JHC85_05225 [Chthoniobacterales bacterium]|nr:hypothetical protein [Chthoniobacterales bacterium]